MNNMKVLDNTKMYRLPYSKNDNPNGWIEVTTFCNMKCAGCYKGIDRGEIPTVHESIEKIKSDILELKRIRNCAIITISGGEALMHPQIKEIVRFVYEQKLKSFIHTNGILLNEPIIRELKKAGLTGFIVRIDVNNRTSFDSEINLHPLRNEIADLINRVRGLQLGFTCVVTKSNLAQVSEVVKWFQQHNAKTDYLVLILKREFCFEPNQQPNNDDEVPVQELAAVLQRSYPNMIFSSYLGGQHSNIDFKWVNSAWIALNGKVLGYADAQMIELSTIINHFKFRNYNYAMNNGRNYLSFVQMLAGCLMLKSMRKFFVRYILAVIKNPLNIFRKANHQVINIVNPPSGSPDTRDFCDACPDAILYEGKLQPSCVLESIKQIKKKRDGN